MLVILMEEQIISPSKVCQTCLMADRAGQPRWRHGQLCCGRPVHLDAGNVPDQYECQMGFRIAKVN